MSSETLLFLHLLGAFLFVSGAAAAAILQLAALRRERVDELATLLGAIRGAVAVVGAGAVLVLVFGIWLAEESGWGLGEGWVLASLALFAASMALGALGGRRDRHTRDLAERLAAERPDADPAEVRARLLHPLSLAANWGSAALVLAILALMVWKPT